MTGGQLIREARLRAGLTQEELGKRVRRPRTMIARWEQDAVEPGFESVRRLLRACGFDLPLELVLYEPGPEERLGKNLVLSPERRVRRLLTTVEREKGYAIAEFDPYAMLAALERHRTTFIVVGAFARVIQGAEEVTRGVDIVPSTRPENLRRLEEALEELGARRIDGRKLSLDEETVSRERVFELRTATGELKVVSEPQGTRGYDDLRRHATREHLGRGLRPSVASTGDLARMLAALGREEDAAKLLQLRRLMELERTRGLGREL